jgi:transposase
VDVLIERCAGIDIGKNEVVTCVRTPGPGGRGRRKQTRTFATFTGALVELADWLTAEGVTEIAMEATGPYWKPVWYVLEERPFGLRLVNAHHVKMLPAARATCSTPNGWPSCSNTGCCEAASCRRRRFASCAI